jgi:hypothetical protein
VANTSDFRLAAWGRWMLSTVIGFIVGGCIGTGAAFVAVPLMDIFIPLLPLPGANTQGAIGYILLGCAIAGAVVAGAVIGAFQWFVLQGWFERSRWWIGATAIGWAGIAVAITILTYTHVAGPVSQANGNVVQTSLWNNAGAIALSVSGVLIATLLMGICQSLALRFPWSKALLWIVMNVLEDVVSTIDELWHKYLRRFALEHWYRFAKQRLHWTQPQLSSTQAAERWSDLMPLLTWQLWLARVACIDSPLPWQPTQDKLSPGRVAQAFPLILAAIGTPAEPPKTRGKSPGRIPGHQPSPRPTYPTVKKRASKKPKTEESLNKADSTAA